MIDIPVYRGGLNILARQQEIEEKEAKAGETVSFDTRITGAEPVSVLEVSSIPPLNLEQRLSYLLGYPHGCAEQITSQAFRN